MTAPKVVCQMLIRRSVSDVFNAFINPAITSKFWFSRGTARLGPDVRCTWYWDKYNASTNLHVLEFVENQRFRISWDEDTQTVEWNFEEVESGTLVRITVVGFQGTDEDVLAQCVDSKGGFTMVLAGAKAFLEFDVSLNLVEDQHPEMSA